MSPSVRKHPRHQNPRSRNLSRLGWTLGLVLAYMVAEAIGGVLTHSLALLADAGHMLSDAGSLGLALFALWIARRPRTPERTFGYHRTEILAALANGVTLVVVAVLIIVEAWHRLRTPQAVSGRAMLYIAVGGLAVNVLSLWILHRGRSDSLNVRGAWLHVVTDALGSVQAILAGALIWAFGWNWADPVASVLIALLVVWSAWKLIHAAGNILMEATPSHIDASEVQAAIREVEGIEQVHDLHVWTITSGFESLSVHARVVGRDRDAVLSEVQSVVRDRFAIEHATIQLEGDEGCEEPPCE
jgi:cobalt-zinc-cadmium efflux system protein